MITSTTPAIRNFNPPVSPGLIGGNLKGPFNLFAENKFSSIGLLAMVAFSFQNVSPSAATVDGLPFPRTYTTELRWYLLARTMQQPPRVAGTSMVSRVPKGHGILSYNG